MFTIVKQPLRLQAGPRGPRRSDSHGASPHSVVGQNSPLLQLQRQVGNRQVGRLLNHPEAAPAEIRRKIATSAVQLSVLRTRKEKLKSALSSSTFDRLISALKDYEQSKSPAEAKALVTLLIGLSGHWLEKYGGKGNDLRKSRVEDLEAEAQSELGRLKAMDRYLADVKGGDVNALSQMGKDIALPEAAQVASGKAGATDGTSAEAVDMVKRYGLSEAEIAAIKIYTASDYLYINPATANSAGWMAAQQGKIGEKAAQQMPRSQKELSQMGALHAGAMMQAFSKLPRRVTTTYRGSRESQASFKATYQDKKTMRFDAFGSSASTQEPAENFAQGLGEQPPQQTQSIHVMCVLNVTNGRQVEGLSIYGAGEREVLLMPGAEFNIDRIEQHNAGPPGGAPQATAWYTVHMSQVK